MQWIKAFHLIFIVTWFAGLFYLPRLFVYHSMAEDKVGQERFKIMERKLFFGIMTPGAVLTIIFGFWLFTFNPSVYTHTIWFQIKILLVATLIVFHIYCGKLYFNFKRDKNTHSHVFYRWLNEVPTVILIAIIILAEVQPHF